MMRKYWKLNLYALIILLIIICLSLFINNPWAKSEDVLSLNLSHKNLGKIVSIIENGDLSSIAAHYPMFGKATIDSEIRDRISNHIEKFNKKVKEKFQNNSSHLPELNIDYEVYARARDSVSIKFIITENFPFYAHPRVSLETLTYDLKSEEQIHLKDFMRGKYLEKISAICQDYFKNNPLYKNNLNNKIFLEGSKPLKKNYKNFLLTDDKLIFIFEKYQIFPGSFGIVSVEIPIKDLKGFIKIPKVSEDYIETLAPHSRDYIREVENLMDRQLDPNKPMVALTFDDGPAPATGLILDTLNKYDSVATFFVLGNRVPDYKETIRKIVDNGSELGNHSYNHKQLTVLSSDELDKQISKTQNAVMEVVGFSPKLLRPTYGSHNDRLRKEVNLPIILWSIDTEDWKSKDPKKIADHVMKNVQDGDIVLMHDLYMSTAQAVDIIVPKLIDKGFQLVTISELYGASGDSLKFGQVYMDNRARPAVTDGD